jgi:glycosyltransferase involved in cell wall biosynthesis
MSRPLRRVGLSLGLLDRLDDGLGEFCAQLVRRVAAMAAQWRESHGVVFDIHLRPSWRGRFGDEVGYLDALEAQERTHRASEPYALWHVLHQHCRLRPPEGTARRLLTVHDLNYLYTKSGISRWRYGRELRTLLSRTDQVVCISEHTAGDLRRHAGWKGPLTVIHNGVRDLTGHPRMPIAGVGPATGRPFLFHLSRMSASKNPRAILGLARLWPEMDFLLCGPASRDTEVLVRGNDLANVHFRLGISDEEKAWAYAECAGFLFPSLTEGFGLPPIEAMYFGKPVFLSRLTALPEVGGSVAHYFDDFEPHAMRAVVESGLRDAAGCSGAVRAHAGRFNWEQAAAGYLRLYADALGLPEQAR